MIVGCLHAFSTSFVSSTLSLPVYEMCHANKTELTNVVLWSCLHYLWCGLDSFAYKHTAPLSSWCLGFHECSQVLL